MKETEKEHAQQEQTIVASITQCLAENYDISGQLIRLPGENRNYLVVSPIDEKYVVKLAADDQSEAFVEMEYLVLQHAARALPGLQLPQIVENKFGNAESFVITGDSIHKRLRIIEYLSGKLLENSDISVQTRFNVGESLAEFNLAVRDFDHPAAHRAHRWDLTKADQYQANVNLLKDPEKASLLHWAFDQYRKINTGNTNHINWQFIHGDANPENILIENEQVIGLLDFGDSCYNPRICELAICLPYLMMDQQDPIAAAKPFIEGYQSVSSLTEQELDLLWPLVLGRLATTISIATERRLLDPNHPNWFVSEDRAWDLLAKLKDSPIFQL